MVSLLNTFFMAFFSLMVVFVLLISMDSTCQVKHIEQLEEITMLTKLPGISLSTSFLENRVSFYEDSSNIFYLNMDINRFTDFVYTQ